MTTENTNTNTNRDQGLSILLKQTDFYSKAHRLEPKKIEDMMVSFAYEAQKVVKKHTGNIKLISIKEAFKCSMDTGIPVDARHLAYLTVYGNELQYEPGYQGYVYKVRQIKPGAVVNTILLWEGDEFTHKSVNGVAEYTYAPVKAVRSDYDNIIGGFCYISYFEHGREYSFVTPMTKEELDLARAKAKTQAVWKVWTGEMYKKGIV